MLRELGRTGAPGGYILGSHPTRHNREDDMTEKPTPTEKPDPEPVDEEASPVEPEPSKPSEPSPHNW